MQTSTAQKALTFALDQYSPQFLLELYQKLKKPRMIEEKMLILLRQGRISKWFAGIGQEGVAVGATAAMQADEFILPMHRNLGVFTGREVPLHRLFAQFQGKESGFTKGRDRSFHFGSLPHHLVGMISHLGPQLSVAGGIALANCLSDKAATTLVFSGDGATSEGDFHEALNVAAVWDLPVIFLVENNGYGLSTPNTEQFRCQYLVDKAVGYGIEGVQVEGNNVLEVYECIRKCRESILETPRPILVEALTFRMRGHEEASGTKYVPRELMDTWAAKDPVANYEKALEEAGLLTEQQKQEITAAIKEEIEHALSLADAEKLPKANTETELADVYAPFVVQEITPDGTYTTKRLVDAIADALRQSMEKFPNLVLMGQDIADYGGVFKITEGLADTFGKHRVRNTPLCESAIVGIALGLSINGYKSMVEMQFADFVTCGFNQIVNNLAKAYYRWSQPADVVVRMPTGGGVAAGPYHSQSTEAWFFHTPGLKIVYPSNPYDAKGLLCASFEDPNPVMYFEHKALYRAISAEVPDEYYTLPIGKAALVSEGKDLSIITYGMGVHWALEAAKEVTENSIEILDLRTLLPWDKEAVMTTVRKTGKVLVCHEACLTGGIGAEIAAWISEHCFEWLDGPVLREASLDTPVPFSPPLEHNFMPKERLKSRIKQLLAY